MYIQFVYTYSDCERVVQVYKHYSVSLIKPSPFT